MKKFLMVLGVIFLCVIIIAVLGFSVAAYYGTKLDKSSKAYVDEITPIIISSWNPQELIDRASPELLKIVSKSKLAVLFKGLSEKLGALKKYKGSKGGSYVNFYPSGKIVTAAYIAQAVFEKSDAEIKIGILQRNGKWQLIEFRVNSEALMP